MRRLLCGLGLGLGQLQLVTAALTQFRFTLPVKQTCKPWAAPARPMDHSGMHMGRRAQAMDHSEHGTPDTGRSVGQVRKYYIAADIAFWDYGVPLPAAACP